MTNVERFLRNGYNLPRWARDYIGELHEEIGALKAARLVDDLATSRTWRVLSGPGPGGLCAVPADQGPGRRRDPGRDRRGRHGWEAAVVSHELDTEIGRCMAQLSHDPSPAEEKRIRARLSRLSRAKRRLIV